ncbi:hypothetical protein DFH11DRAFT_1686003 [Phellopilus nigrolimitatus]|nr:hypothetical protein DFH11DRAFT_1686003 [Phellopilus nigrolimitatus]
MSLDTNIQISRSRVAIITGPAGDLGRAIALRLASDGFLLALTDLPEREIDLVSLNAEIDKAQIASKADILYVTGDISVEADVQRIVDATVEKFGNLDVMVSNAAIFKSLSIDAMDSETWDKIFSVNVRGMMLCYKWAAKQMVKQGRGGKLIGDLEQAINSQIFSKLTPSFSPEDIACLVSFLASKGSAYITGQTYSCDGGMHIA